MPVGSSIRIYDLARELKQDTKRIIEELRREGADVSVPSNAVSRELAEKIRNKYFPKTETAPKRIFKAFRKPTTNSSTITSLTAENKTNIIKTQTPIERNAIQPSLAVIENKSLSTQTLISPQREVSNIKLITEQKIDCRECLRPTKHNLIYSADMVSVEWNEKYQIVQCMGCESISFCRITFKNNQSNNKEKIDLYPSRIRGRQKLKIESLPPTIAEIYEEIHLALSNNLLVLATIGIRTLIEAVCDEKNSTARSLRDKINSLVDMKLLTPKNANNLNKLRSFGNLAAHEVKTPSEYILHNSIDIIEHLLKEVYLPEI